MYAIRSDRRKALVEVTVTGFWREGEAEAFRAALAQEIATVRSGGRAHATLYDYTDAVIQSQETVAVLAAMARDNPFKARKTAIYTAGRLARRQAQRIAEAGQNLRLFDDREAALAWLDR